MDTEVEKLQELIRDYKTTITEMTKLQNRYDNTKDEYTYKILELSNYIASNIETRIIDMYLLK